MSSSVIVYWESIGVMENLLVSPNRYGDNYGLVCNV